MRSFQGIMVERYVRHNVEQAADSGSGWIRRKACEACVAWRSLLRLYAFRARYSGLRRWMSAEGLRSLYDLAVSAMPFNPSRARYGTYVIFNLFMHDTCQFGNVIVPKGDWTISL